MHRIALDVTTPDEIIEEMDHWCRELLGYVGETEMYFTDSYRVKFYHAAFLPEAEDAVAFRLRFGI